MYLFAQQAYCFSNYMEVLQKASSQSPSVLSLRPEDETFYTFFAPTDAAIQRMDAVSPRDTHLLKNVRLLLTSEIEILNSI